MMAAYSCFRVSDLNLFLSFILGGARAVRSLCICIAEIGCTRR